jgi:hypothetical protein
VGVQIADDHLDIADVIARGERAFGALRCHSGDLRDTPAAWLLPRDLRDRLGSGGVPGTPQDHDAA